MGVLLACVLLGHTMLALAAWVAIGVLWQGLRRTVCVPDKAYASVAAFAPFRSEADWREHEGVLESYGLPPYDPSRYREPGPGGTYLMAATNHARTEGPWTPEPWGPGVEIVALPVALILFQRPAVLPMIDGAASQMAGEVGCPHNPDFGALPNPDTTPPREP
jgi:hypothetical protein